MPSSRPYGLPGMAPRFTPPQTGGLSSLVNSNPFGYGQTPHQPQPPGGYGSPVYPYMLYNFQGAQTPAQAFPPGYQSILDWAQYGGRNPHGLPSLPIQGGQPTLPQAPTNNASQMAGMGYYNNGQRSGSFENYSGDAPMAAYNGSHLQRR